MKRFTIVGVLAVVFCVLSARADYEMPAAQLCTYLNGRLNLLVTSNGFTSVTAGISGDYATTYSRMTFEVQVKHKGTDNSTYVTVSGSIPDYTDGWEQRGKGAYFIWVSDALSLAPGCLYTVRARATATSGGEVTDWKEMGDVLVYATPKTYIGEDQIYSSGARNDWKNRGNDGSIVTFFEDNADNGKSAYFGWSFRSHQKLIGVRYLHRSTVQSRSVGAVFEVADDAGFTTNVREVHTISSPGATPNTMYEIMFSEPVACWAARVRSSQYGNFDEVEWITATGITTDFTTDANVYPVLSWPIGETSAMTSHLEWSYGGSSGWTQIGATMSGNGYFTVTNTTALVGQTLYYRVAKSDGTYLGPIANTRCRRLDRDPSNEKTLLTGNVALKYYQFEESKTDKSGNSQKLFDGDEGTFLDVGAYKLVGGLQLGEAAHIVAVEAMPRTNSVVRQSNLLIKAAASEAEYLAEEHVLLSPRQPTSAAVYYRYVSLDQTNLYTHVFGYCDGTTSSTAWYGNTAEMRIYGWNSSDEAVAGAAIATPTLSEGTLDDLTPSVSWTVAQIGYITSSQLQYAYQEDGPWTALGDEQASAATFTVKLNDAKIGITTYYRVKYETVEGTRYTASIDVTKPRPLERDTMSSTSIRTGVEILPYSQYDSDKEGYTQNVEGALKNVYDTDTNSNANVYYLPGWGGPNAVMGVKLPDAAHVVGAYLYGRNTRFKAAALYGAVTADDFAKTNIVELAARKGSSATAKVWTDFRSVDTTNAYQYVFFYGSPAASSSDRLWYGDVNELYFIGYSEADAIAAGGVVAPTDFRALSSGGRFLWTTVANAESYALERRASEADAWSVVTENIASAATTCSDAANPRNTTYQYRLTVYGLDGKMKRSTEPISVTVRRRLVICIR